MRIYLFLNTKILTFSLPKDISGSYSFDYDVNEASKLINIEARDSEWVLYSTSDSAVINNGIIAEGVSLKADNFYNIKRNEEMYLIYTEDISNRTLSVYQYGNRLNLIIGNTNNCNIRYDYGLNVSFEVKIFNDQGVVRLHQDSGNVYVNGFAVNQDVALNIGDVVNVFSLKLTFLANIVLINYIPSKLTILDMDSGISKYVFQNDEEPVEKEIKDIDLYTQNDYYAKSPRLKRIIEKKDIKLDAPPAENSTQELPLILTIGPMLTMGATSVVTILSTLSRIGTGGVTLKDQIPTLVMSATMLVSMLVWPLATNFYNKHLAKKNKKDVFDKYTAYLKEKRAELENEMVVQRDIITENLLTVSQCIDIINHGKVNFWDKRVDQSDFLVARIGIGNQELDVDISYPEEGFTTEESELKKKADELIQEFKYIKDVPVSYSFYENLITAIMGNEGKTLNFINNILLQFLTFYTYEDLKIVMLTNENNAASWSYLKYLNHCFDNSKQIRFYATESESIKAVLDYLDFELNQRINQKEVEHIRPHYLIIIDDYGKVKRHDFIKKLIEQDNNLGFNVIIRENSFKNLPSKCNNFIMLNDGKSGILKNSYEGQEQVTFVDEIVYGVNMMSVCKVLSNIPIEFEEGTGHLPDSLSFLEMEKVGKVEQLNILNRWNTNDSTTSLKAEIGFDEQEDLMFLDLHEKHHGPHGLIAGTTGSGKSEFIITYILSMCVNYSPNDVSFILIDYKGGGLALAFENRNSGVVLPHLAGTITNLDKAEMDRTLVSIDSEVKRRQLLFNDAKDKLGESTMDIYKYQRHFHDGSLDEPITHLFIICDEFAELKSQQPEFMDNLISVARIGRSLGVHLILATQKPSGVVNDQIWSNTRFRVCLKVQDESDSKEMLKKPDAAYIKQAGRYYLQVGYDEFYALGQSGWCGAKYYPSNKLVKQVDKSINFINDCGQFIKSIQAQSGSKGQAQGEQIAAILKEIINVADKQKLKSKRLWLENIPPVILVDNVIERYKIQPIEYNVKAILGEYDAPEKQEQGILEYDVLEDGNTIIYGLDSGEKEMLLNTIIYSTTKYHSPKEINFYTLDYGSESLRMFANFPHIGGMVFAGEDEKFKNLFKYIQSELKTRKKLLSKYGGDYNNYNKNSNNKLPLKVFILNNYDSIYENNQSLYEILPDLVRDSERYGIIFIITANNLSSVANKVSQNFRNIYTYKLKDALDYSSAFGTRKKIEPREIIGRGLADTDDVHEFQTCCIVENEGDLSNYILKVTEELQSKYSDYAEKLPELPEQVVFDIIKNDITTMASVPIGISRSEISVVKYDFLAYPGTVISSNKIHNTNNFLMSLLNVLVYIPNQNILFIDGLNKIPEVKNVIKNYYNENYDTILEKIIEYLSNLETSGNQNNQLIIVYGLDKFMSSLSSTSKFGELINIIKKNEKYRFIILDDANKIKQYSFEEWFAKNVSLQDGIWVGKGIDEQNLFKIGVVKKDLLANISASYGYYIIEGGLDVVKLIDFSVRQDNNK